MARNERSTTAKKKQPGLVRENKALIKANREPFYDAPLMRQICTDDPPIDLEGPNSTAAKHFAGTVPAPAQFDLGDDLFVPASLSKENLGIKLALQVSGGNIAPHVRVTVKIAGGTVKKQHHTQLEFYPGIASHLERFRYHKVSKESSEASSAHYGYHLSWDTQGGIGTGLGVSLPNALAETQHVMTHMRTLSQDCNAGWRDVRIIVQDIKIVEVILEMLLKQSTANLTPWHPYCGADQVARCGFSDMYPRARVKSQSGGLIRYPARNSFISRTEAHIILAYGTMLEYRQAPLLDLRHRFPGTQKSETWIEEQLLALGILFDIDASHTIQEWWPVILNQRPDQLRVNDLVAQVNISQSLVEARMTAVLDAFNWDDQQKAAIESSLYVTGRVKIIEGAPGTGKTCRMAGIASLYAALGFAVLLCAPTATAARILDQKVRECLDLLGPQTRVDCGLQNPPLKLIDPRHDLPLRKLKEGKDISSLLGNAKMVVSTPNVICSESFCIHFGQSAKATVVLADESEFILESELLATIFRLECREKVKALVMTCDIREWPMNCSTQTEPMRQLKREQDKNREERMERSIMSLFHEDFFDRLFAQKSKKNLPDRIEKAKSNMNFLYGRNEFADQVGLAFVYRLRRQEFPVTRLKRQYRVREALTKFPNRRAYKHQIIANPNPKPHPTIDAFQSFLRKWLGYEGANADWSSIFIQASEGEGNCIKARGKTESKRNHRNADVVTDLVISNHKANAVKSEDIVIITQYRDQVRLYEKTFEERAKEHDISVRDLPLVTTLDRFRGQQATIIIYDLVVTQGDSSHGIGIVADEWRANFVATRATDMLLLVGSVELVTVFPAYWRELMAVCGTPSQREPYIVEYCTTLSEEGLAFVPHTPAMNVIPFQIPKHLWTDDKDDFDASWERATNYSYGYDPNFKD